MSRDDGSAGRPAEESVASRLVEEERSQIAHEIHDELLPRMFAARSILHALARDLEASAASTPAVADRLSQARRCLDDAMLAGRGLLERAYPPELAGRDWDAAAAEATRRFLEAADPGEADPGEGAEIRWRVTEAARRLSDAASLAAFRISTEAVRNAIRHGRASRIDIDADVDDGVFRLRVTDNGRGFDPGAVTADRFGIRTMRSRARLVGGTLRIDSRPGGPTEVTLRIGGQAFSREPV